MCELKIVKSLALIIILLLLSFELQSIKTTEWNSINKIKITQ